MRKGIVGEAVWGIVGEWCVQSHTQLGMPMGPRMSREKVLSLGRSLGAICAHKL